jgi:hypothetical protein
MFKFISKGSKQKASHFFFNWKKHVVSFFESVNVFLFCVIYFIWVGVIVAVYK